ncbi:dTDP-4-dehydrorhamnose reductase [Castellaniella sp. MT123]|uniref:dTDP-4-dehydrorhamnose reductase n=1 Tax=Castellaniella sp. MT123 TaxID=3140381 RepID=UPI0031F3E759
MTSAAHRGRAPRVLVTGGDGQLGRSLRALADPHTDTGYIFASRADLDITDNDAIVHWLDAHPADCLINAAAYTAVDRAASEPELAMAINAQAPGLLARHCHERGIRLLHVSTDYVFDGRADRPYRETDPVAPLNTYGRGKWLGEQAVLRAAPDAIVLRTSWVFSAWGTNFVHTMLRLGAQHDRLRIIDDQIGGPTWAGHLAQALDRLTRLAVVPTIKAPQGESSSPMGARWSTEPAAGIPGGVYHFAGSPWVSWYGFAREIFTQAHDLGLIGRIPVLEAIGSADWPSPEPRPANSRLDCARLESLLGPLERDWRDGLRQVLTYNASLPFNQRPRPWHA